MEDKTKTKRSNTSINSNIMSVIKEKILINNIFLKYNYSHKLCHILQ